MKPRPPWHPFPLTEIVVLVAVLCALGAVLTFGSPRAFWFGGAALALGLLAGLEIPVREHLSGYRSHAATLGAVVGCGLSAIGVVGAESPVQVLCVSIAGFLMTAAALHWEFRRHR